jgi:RNA exonuclease 1
LVDFDLKVVYDTLLKPERPITDYNTKYSGITFEMMKDVTKTLPDVHRELARFIGSKTVLIGHSLENDLNCLQVNKIDGFFPIIITF